MAKLLSICVVICAVFIFGLPKIGRATHLSIDISNKKSASVSCQTLDDRDVLFIQILKAFGKKEKMIAYIDDHQNTAITSNPKFKVSGLITKKSNRISFLVLTIPDPKPEVEGHYSCDVYYKDKSGNKERVIASGSLLLGAGSIEELETLRTRVKDLTSSVSSCLETSKSQQDDSKQFADVCKTQIKNQDSKIDELKTKLSVVTKSENTCHEQGRARELDLTILKDTVKGLIANGTSCKGELDKQNKATKYYKTKLSEITGKEATCRKLGQTRDQALKSLKDKINDLSLNVTSQRSSCGEQATKQGKLIKDLQTKLTSLKSQMASKEKTCDEKVKKEKTNLENLQTSVKDLNSKLTAQTKLCQQQTSKQGVEYEELKKKMDRVSGEYSYQFESIRRNRYVTAHGLNQALKNAKTSFNSKLISETRLLNSTIFKTREDLEEKYNALDKDLGSEFNKSIEKLNNITKEFAKKGDLSDFQERVDTVENLLEKEAEQISLLRDKVSVNEALMKSLSSNPPTQTGSDPVVEVIEKINALEQDSHNKTHLIQFLMDKDVLASKEIKDLADVTNHLNKTLLGLSQKDQELDASAFSARLKKTLQAIKENVIVFDDVFINKGNAYDPTTGVFTAPRSGIYGFNLVVLSRMTDKWIDVDLQANNKVLVTLTSYEISHEDQTAANAIAKLDAGDQVKAIIKYTTQSKQLLTKIVDLEFSIFSGYFIQPV